MAPVRYIKKNAAASRLGFHMPTISLASGEQFYFICQITWYFRTLSALSRFGGLKWQITFQLERLLANLHLESLILYWE